MSATARLARPPSDLDIPPWSGSVRARRDRARPKLPRSTSSASSGSSTTSVPAKIPQQYRPKPIPRRAIHEVFPNHLVAASRSAPSLTTPLHVDTRRLPREIRAGVGSSPSSAGSAKSKANPLFVPGSFVSSTWSIGQSSPAATGLDARDRYGFRKQSQYITVQEYDDWLAKYDVYCDRRRRKWEILIREHGIDFDEDGIPTSFPPKSRKVKRYVRKGIPPEWRGAAWFWYAKGHDYLRNNAGLYDRLWQRGVATPPPDSELIERDLHRTFPDNIHFRNTEWQQSSVPTTPGSQGSGGNSRRNSSVPEMPIVQALRRVLLAFSLYVPKTGYCQSLNFLAGLLLLFMGEEKAFWMLVIITQKYLPGMHEINLEGANIDQGVLMMCVKESIPVVWNKIGAGLDGYHHDDNMILRLPPITLCTAAWFMSGYIGVLPIESVVRIWDCFFYEDSKVFFRIALTILKMGESQIENVRDPMEIFQVVQTVPKHLLDVNALMQACFKRRNGFGHISQEEIVARRKFVAEKRKSNTAGSAIGDVSGEDKAKYRHYDAITGTYQSRSNFGKRMQMLRMGSNNMLSLNASDDYFSTSHDEVSVS